MIDAPIEARHEEAFLDRVGSRIELFLPVLVFVIAAALRLVDFTTIPRGLLYDEAYNGLDALRILAGARPVYLTANFGREPLFQYVQALAIALFGPTDWALRSVAAVFGILTVPIAFVFFRRLLGRRVATLAIGWLAVSVWHVIFSRTGLRAVSFPAFEAAVFYCFWRGWEAVGAVGSRKERTGQIVFWWASTGLWTGLSMYTYSIVRFEPFVLVLYAVGLAMARRLTMRQLIAWTTVVGSLALLVFSPLALFFIRHPDELFTRADVVSIFNPDFNGGSPAIGLLHGITSALGALAVAGDAYWDRNVSHQPIFDPVSTGLLILGLAIALRRIREPRYSFLLLWFGVMLLPGFLTAKDAPNYLHLIGIIPVVFVWPAIGADRLWSWWEGRSGSRSRMAPVFVALAALLVGTALTARSYFGVWAHAPEVSGVFAADRWLAMESAWPLVSAGHGSVFVAAGEPDDPLEEYFWEGRAAGRRVRIFNGARSLIFPASPESVAYLFAGQDHPPRALLQRYFPGQSEQLVTATLSGQTVVRYQLPADRPAFAPQEPVLVNVGDRVQVYGFDLPRDVTAGTTFEVNWYWRILANDPRELVFFNQLLDAGRQRRAQIDDRAFPPNYWAPGTPGISTYQITVPPNLETGAYRLAVGIYHRDDFQRLPLRDANGKSVGTELDLGPIKVHGRPRPTPTIERRLLQHFGDGVDLAGFNISPAAIKPGDTLSLTLDWAARQRPKGDYTVFVHLLDGHGKPIAIGDAPPVQGAYPTTVWDAGEVIADTHHLAIGAGVPPGTYRLEVGLYDPKTLQRLPVLDAQGKSTSDRVVIPNIVVGGNGNGG